jgi:hypothetical protein
MCWQLWYIIDRGFEPRLGHTKDYKIGICCFSAKHAALRRKSKDWLVRNQNNVSEWNHMSTRGLLFQWASTIKFQLSCWSSTKHTSSSSHWKLTCSHHDTAEELLNWRHTKITHSITLIDRDIFYFIFQNYQTFHRCSSDGSEEVLLLFGVIRNPKMAIQCLFQMGKNLISAVSSSFLGVFIG